MRAAAYHARRHPQQQVRLHCQAASRCQRVPAASQTGLQDQPAPGGGEGRPSVMMLPCWAWCCHPHPELGLRCPPQWRLLQESCHGQGQLGGPPPARLSQTVVVLQGHRCPPAGPPQAPADGRTVSDGRSWCATSWPPTYLGGWVGRQPQQGPPRCLLAIQGAPPDGLGPAAAVQLGRRPPVQCSQLPLKPCCGGLQAVAWGTAIPRLPWEDPCCSGHPQVARGGDAACSACC